MNDITTHHTSKAAPHRRWQFAAVGLMLASLAGVALGEWFGWPFLAAPLQYLLSDTLDRQVRFFADTDANTSHANAFRVHFVGGVRLYAKQLEIAAPAWSSAPHLLLAQDVALNLRYSDLWHAHRGQPLRIHSLQASTLDAHLERLADGRASWKFGRNPVAAQPLVLPFFDNLQVTSGTLHYLDLPLAADVNARLSLVNATPPEVVQQAEASTKAAAFDQSASILQLNAAGYYRKQPLKIELISSGRLLSAADKAPAVPVVLTLNATLGRATLAFKGSTVDVLHPREFAGDFRLKGPSMAAVGDMVGVTLPTTAEFQTDGVVDKRGSTWRVRIDDATVGASRLNGTFIYEKTRGVPLLSGRLGGARLLLADLGPALGTMPAAASSRGKGMVLPDRHFDLPALSAMDADVLIEISYVDLNTSFLAPLRPLHGHLQLTGGVLTLRDIDARTAQGKLMGDLRLDGRGAMALWNADLRWDGVRLEQWIRQVRAEGSPPFVSGGLNGRAILQGQGRSTAEILASLKGHVRTDLSDGAVSHFSIEVAGLDLAQGLGVKFKGDNVLPVQCAVADLVAEGGVLRPRVMVLDTKDSAIWVDGSLSLATEALDLRAVVVPKDFSPLTLRAPLRVRGSFAKPEVSLEKRPMGLKLAASFLLALVNPFAALIPLVDSGNADEAERLAARCQGVMQRGKANPAAAMHVSSPQHSSSQT